MTTNQILSQAEQLISTLKQLMPTIYQQETLESILGLFLGGQGNSVPHHCQTKSESALSRFFNYYQWPTRAVIRTVRSKMREFDSFSSNQRTKTDFTSNGGFNYLRKGRQVSKPRKFSANL